MHKSTEIKAALVALAVSLSVLGMTFSGSALLQRERTAAVEQGRPTTTANNGEAPSTGAAQQGRSLFERNCAHCHGDDARGDEGPSLYDLKQSDVRIATIIKGGIKGEMPKFGSKLGDADIQALTAYLRTLRD